jgi:flagellar P-ring protein precursor FlgI
MSRIGYSVLLLLALFTATQNAAAQDVRVRDITISTLNVPLRLVGYGLVVGLDGTGDRAVGGYGSGHTVRSVANLLRRFEVVVPERVLRTRNVAAVLVTAEASPYLRPGGRFEVQVASLGDAVSLRGGTLWTTPLVSEVAGHALATAQGPLLLDGADGRRDRYTVETSARIPDGGLVEVDLPRQDFNISILNLLLKEPEIGMAMRIAEAINDELGAGTGEVVDPGSIALTLPNGESNAAFLARVGQIRVTLERRPRLIVNSRDGTVVAGGDLRVGEAVVSSNGITLSIGAAETMDDVLGDVRVAPGTSVQDVAAALHAIGAPPHSIAAMFESLREVGALTAEVVVR